MPHNNMYAQSIKEKKLSFGGRALAVRFPAHGSVSIAGSIAGGSQSADHFLKQKNRSGSGEFAKIHADMLLEGTKKHSKKELQILLDTIGASLSFDTTHKRLEFFGRVRVKHLETLLSIIAEVLGQPSFPQSELEILKRREIANLAYEVQDTRTQASIALSRLIYTHNHPNYNETTDESREELGKITSQELSDFHASLVDGSSLILSIAGDLAPQKVFSFAEKQFKKLPRTNMTLPTFVPASAGKPKKATTKIEHKANIDYNIGIATGITANHPDYPALMLGMQILGNPGFTGRLMQTVREQEGLTYGVYSYFAGLDDGTDGHLMVWATFAPELFKKGRAAVLREVKKIVEQGATSDEVKKHRERYEANFRTRLSNSTAFARAAHDTIAEGRPLKYLDEFPKKILTLTPRMINIALKKYLVPEKMSEAAAGIIDKL
jgi:zinc protease